MPRRKKPTASTGTGKKDSSAGDGNKDYEVGYRRPPIHSQFQPGQSGNPAGRCKGLHNFMTDVKGILITPLRVKEDGRTRIKSTQQGLLMLMREKALRGNERALDRFLALAERFNNAAAEIAPAQTLSADDQAILEAYVAERADAAITPQPPKPTTTRHRNSASAQTTKKPNE